MPWSNPNAISSSSDRQSPIGERKSRHGATESTVGLDGNNVWDGDKSGKEGHRRVRSTSVSLRRTPSSGLSKRASNTNLNGSGPLDGPLRRPFGEKTAAQDPGHTRPWLYSTRRVRRKGLRFIGLLGVGVVSLVGLLTIVMYWDDGQRPLPKPKFTEQQRSSYEAVPYQHLNISEPTTLHPGTRVFHVTKEFGPASMGGLGTALTALVQSQQSSDLLDVSVIMPYYSYLRSGGSQRIKTKGFAELAIDYRPDPVGAPKDVRTVTCHVSVAKWSYIIQDYLHPEIPLDDTTSGTVTIYLMGPGDRQPFKNAFKAEDAGDIYSAYKPLPQEWKDLYFAKAVSELIAFINSESEAASIFDETDEDDDGVISPSRSTAVDILHVHGATNAMVLHYIEYFKQKGMLGSSPPGLVYGLHDYLDEVEYSNRLTNVLSFLTDRPGPGLSEIAPLESYIHEDQVFPSALGIDLSDLTTFVSESVAADIVELRFDFYLKELIMSSLLRKTLQGAFFGITNGLDFGDSARNPFTSPILLEKELAFPRVGEDVTDFRTFWRREEGNRSPVSFSNAKLAAKRVLIAALPDLFTEKDLQRPILLFIGRFQYNKGCDFFHPVVNALEGKYDARLVAMGARNNFPHDTLQWLKRTHSDRFTLIDDAETQHSWGTVIRMASDFAFVPSFTESFGLVAAEGLLFGMGVISSGVGGLSEFLTPMSPDLKYGNAYLFDALGTDRDRHNVPIAEEPIKAEGPAGRNKQGLDKAISRGIEVVLPAVETWKEKLREGEHSSWVDRETFVRRMVSEALRLRWDREGGPVEQYNLVYQRAIQDSIV